MKLHRAKQGQFVVNSDSIHCEIARQIEFVDKRTRSINSNVIMMNIIIMVIIIFMSTGKYLTF